MSVEPLKLLFTAEQFERMGQTGIISEDNRVELIEGEILAMVPIGPPHASTVIRLNQLFTARLGPRALVAVQSPVLLNDLSEPQPDLLVVRPEPDYYIKNHPGPADVLLLVEVADSSLWYDRHTKLPLYARSGIVETWLVDLLAGQVEAHRDLGPAGYGTVSVHTRESSLHPIALPDLEIDVRDILGP